MANTWGLRTHQLSSMSSEIYLLVHSDFPTTNYLQWLQPTVMATTPVSEKMSCSETMVQGPLSNFQEHILKINFFFMYFSLVVFKLFGNVLRFSYPFYTTVAPAGRNNNLHNCVYIYNSIRVQFMVYYLIFFPDSHNCKTISLMLFLVLKEEEKLSSEVWNYHVKRNFTSVVPLAWFSFHALFCFVSCE